MASKGWISVHREIQDHWVWEEKPFSKGQAWLDLLMMANYKPNKFVLGNELVQVERGQFITSELKLMERWGWGKSKTRSFLKLLQDDEMIVKESDRKKTTISIVKYSDYQILETTDEPQTNHKQTDNRLITDTNNKDNKENKDNKRNFGEFSNVKLSEIEHKKLIDQYGDKVAKAFIEKLDAYIESTGKKYKSHYATILSWIRKEPNIKKTDYKKPTMTIDA